MSSMFTCIDSKGYDGCLFLDLKHEDKNHTELVLLLFHPSKMVRSSSLSLYLRFLNFNKHFRQGAKNRLHFLHITHIPVMIVSSRKKIIDVVMINALFNLQQKDKTEHAYNCEKLLYLLPVLISILAEIQSI